MAIKKLVLQRNEFNRSEKLSSSELETIKLLKKIFIRTNHITLIALISNYLNFNVTTANTTDKIVTTQNRTAILLSWYPSF